MRIGKFVEHFKAAAIASDSKSLDPVLKYLAVGRQLGYGVYLALDSVCYMDQSGIYKLQSGARLQKEAYRAWLAGLVCNALAGAYTLYNLSQLAQKQAGSEDAEKHLEAKKLEKYDDPRFRVRDVALMIVGSERRRSYNFSPTFAIFPRPLQLSASPILTMASLG